MNGGRVGIGYDSHRFAAGRRLVLGGVEIEHELGLEGHSDADVLTHAVIDAVLGAAGSATSAPTSRPTTSAGATRTRSTCCARSSACSRGRCVNVDATVICEAPRLGDAPSADGAQPRRGARCAGEREGDHATRAWGSSGRGEGIACIAVALVATEPQ